MIVVLAASAEGFDWVFVGLSFDFNRMSGCLLTTKASREKSAMRCSLTSPNLSSTSLWSARFS